MGERVSECVRMCVCVYVCERRERGAYVSRVRDGNGEGVWSQFRRCPPTSSSGFCRRCYFGYGGKEKSKTTALFTDLDAAAVGVAEVVVASNLLAKILTRLLMITTTTTDSLLCGISLRSILFRNGTVIPPPSPMVMATGPGRRRRWCCV